MKDKKTIRKMFLASEEEFYKALSKYGDYKDIHKRREIVEEVLTNSVNKDIYQLFDEVCSLQNEMTAYLVEEAYVKGFSDANKLREESIR